MNGQIDDHAGPGGRPGPGSHARDPARCLSKPAAKEDETQDVIVAARDFKDEEVLKADMVKPIRMAKSAVPAGAFSSFKDIEDRWVKTTMLEGRRHRRAEARAQGQRRRGSSRNIPKGMRAFAVEVNEQSGVSGFILPGHRVDVVRFEQGEKSRSSEAETILQDILVLAAGQVFTRPEEKSVQSRTVTLAVTPEQVDILVAAKAKGPLSLSLRGRQRPRDRRPPQAQARGGRAGEGPQDQAREGARGREGPPAQAREKRTRRPQGRAGEEAGRAAAPASAPTPPPPPPTPKKRYVSIYRGLDNMTKISVDESSVNELAQRPAATAPRAIASQGGPGRGRPR